MSIKKENKEMKKEIVGSLIFVMILFAAFAAIGGVYIIKQRALINGLNISVSDENGFMSVYINPDRKYPDGTQFGVFLDDSFSNQGWIELAPGSNSVMYDYSGSPVKVKVQLKFPDGMLLTSKSILYQK